MNTQHIRLCFTDYDRRTLNLYKLCGVTGKVLKVPAQLSFRSSSDKWAALKEKTWNIFWHHSTDFLHHLLEK